MRLKTCSTLPMRGFSLTELAVVLVIIGLLLGGLTLPLAAQHELRQWRSSETSLQQIREALLGYAAIHGQLPCPDSDTDPGASGYGEAELSCPSSSQEAFLPFKTLGLEATDPWGRRWHYRVDPGFANVLSPISLSTTPVKNGLQVVNHTGHSLTTLEEAPVAIVYSLGANGRADGENASFEILSPEPGSKALYQAGPPSPEFDDALYWLARPLLISRLIAAGRAL